MGALLAATAAAPVLCANALMSGRGIPALLELMGPRESRTQSFPTLILGAVVMTIMVIATGTALGSVFDPRWQDLPFASLTMAAVPLVMLSWLNRPRTGAHPIAEMAFAAIFLFGALYVVFIEESRTGKRSGLREPIFCWAFRCTGSAARARLLSSNLPFPEQDA